MLYPASQVGAAENEGSSAIIEEMIVTARKRTESVQDIPASIQALSAEQIKNMGANTIADYGRFIPSVNVVSKGSGVATIVFRGATTDGGGSYVAQTTSSVYLDEFSVTSTGEQPSIRMVDIARIEALSGPQGTIYGSDAQAGTMRIVTNKPVMNKFEAVVDVSLRTMSEGEGSYDGSIVLNIPLVEDKLALRLVGFNAKDGGYIDNVFGHTPDTAVITDVWFGGLPADYGRLDNAGTVEKNWNDSKVTGWRAALRWEINDNWAATVTALYQDTDSGAYGDYDPFVGDLKTVRFFDEFREDEYNMYSLVIEGDLGFAQLVSATSYYDRDIKQTIDNTVYHHYWSAAYCTLYVTDYTARAPYYFPYYTPYVVPDGSGVVLSPQYCNAPTIGGDYLSAYEIPGQQDRFTQEIRLSSQGDTVDWIVGLYYEDSNNSWQANFAYPTSNAYQDTVSLDAWELWYGQTQAYRDGDPSEIYDPAARQLLPQARAHWYSQTSTDWDQKALFGEVTWYATDALDLTVGGRYFDRKNDNFYFVEHPDTRLLDEYVDGSSPLSLKGDETEFVPKVSVAYNLDSDTMIYGLWTEGYRPGGTNRSRGDPFFPNTYFADKMTNWETGFKTTLADGSIRLNITAFYMDWEDYQLELVDPSQNTCPDTGPAVIATICGQPWQNIVANAGDAHIMGATVEFDWAVSDSFIVGMNAEWLEAETDTTLDLNGDGEINVRKGNRLPIVPELKASAWATYYWPMEMIDGDGFVRLQWSYTGDSNNILEPNPVDNSNSNPQFNNASYNIGDLRVGVEGPTWEVSVFINNLTDERAQYSHEWGIYEFGQGNLAEGRSNVARIYTNRPREMGIRFIKHFGD